MMKKTVSSGHIAKAIEFTDWNQMTWQYTKRSYTLVKNIHENLFFLVQFSHLVMSNSLQHHEAEHARSPSPSPIPKVHTNPCPLSQRCHPTICRSLFLLPSIFLSIRVFSNESALCIRWPYYTSSIFFVLAFIGF